MVPRRFSFVWRWKQLKVITPLSACSFGGLSVLLGLSELLVFFARLNLRGRIPALLVYYSVHLSALHVDPTPLQFWSAYGLFSPSCFHSVRLGASRHVASSRLGALGTRFESSSIHLCLWALLLASILLRLVGLLLGRRLACHVRLGASGSARRLARRLDGSTRLVFFSTGICCSASNSPDFSARRVRLGTSGSGRARRVASSTVYVGCLWALLLGRRLVCSAIMAWLGSAICPRHCFPHSFEKLAILLTEG